MKIVLTVHQFFPEYASGTEVLTYSVAKELRRLGHELVIYTGFPAAVATDDNGRLDEYWFDGFRVFRFHHASVPMGGQRYVTEIEYCNLLAARFFKKIIGEFRPDIIHFVHFGRLGAALMDVAFAEHIPSFLTPTDFWSVCPTSQLLLENGRMCGGPSPRGGNCVAHIARLTRGNRAKSVLRRVPQALFEVVTGLTARGLLPEYPLSHEIAAMSRRRPFIVDRLNALERIIVPTQLMFDVLAANGVEPQRMIKSGYGIDVSYYQGMTEKKGREGPLVLGFIGTLASHKGCHVLVEAMNGVKSVPISLKIYGRGADFPDYYAKLLEGASGNSNIEFCGTFPNVEIGTVLSQIDVLVVPSVWYENTPLVIYSALASGCPIVASDFPGMSEVVHHGVNGLLFPPGEVQGLRSALLRLVQDPNLLDALRSNCVEPKSVGAYTAEIVAEYDAAIAHRATGASRRATRAWLPIQKWESPGQGGHISGWAVHRLRPPQELSLVVAGTVVARTRAFSPRPDVIAGFGSQGIRLKSPAIGFLLQIPFGVRREDAVLTLRAGDGTETSIPLKSIDSGRVVPLENQTYIAIDAESWG